VIFVGEVVVVAAILLGIRSLRDAPVGGRAPRLDVVGALLSAGGMAVSVLALLQASTWGWVRPKDSPVEPFGFSLTLFLLGGGVLLLGAFVRWERRRKARGEDALVDLAILSVAPVRAGLTTFTAQNLILMGTFFVLPLYLQLVQGLDALESGIKLLPVSVAMLVASAAGPKLVERFSVRTLVRSGVLLLALSLVVLLSTIEPVLRGPAFGLALALMGTGLGLIASQLGNVIQSSVDASQRGEAGGLQYTAQQLGSSLGVALIGGLVISGLATGFVREIEDAPEISDEVSQQVSVELEGGIDFVPAAAVEDATAQAGLDEAQSKAVVDSYEDAQLFALKAGLLAAMAAAIAAWFATTNLPSRRPERAPPAEAVS
jgi:Na+/melibiose symporter-like transporter